MPAERVLRRGDRVRIRRHAQEVRGLVLFGSACGRSLMLVFDGMLGGYVQAMPVLQEEGEAFHRDLVEGFQVEITREEERTDGTT